VSILDARTLEKKSAFAVAREPRTVVVSKDGANAFVSHAVGKWVDVVPLSGLGPPRAIAVSGSEEVVGRHMMTSELDRSACQGFALAKADTGRIFAPQVLVFSDDPSTTSEGYGGGDSSREPEAFHVPVIDEDAASVVAESSRIRAGAERQPKCALPRAAAVGRAGLFVTCLGEDSVVLYDATMVHPDQVEIARWRVPSGPVGIAIDEPHARAVVWSQFAHALTTIAVSDGSTPRPFSLSSVTLPRDVRTSARVERGRALFHATGEERISGDGRACASCHPDGRDDTLVWSSPNGPRQTPMLAGRLDGAAPYGWNGDAKDVPTHLVSTFKRLGGKGLTGDDKESLMAYVATLRTPPSAKTHDEAITRGAAIFRSEKTGCSSCHGETGDLPDGAAHDVKSITEGDVRRKFDTPSLRFVGGTAPYFHDGRFGDLRTLIVKSDGKMGHTKHLSPGEVSDLATYLESL
jgi:cytochrome c peroxidase